MRTGGGAVVASVAVVAASEEEAVEDGPSAEFQCSFDSRL